jgi:hypothetical protein
MNLARPPEPQFSADVMKFCHLGFVQAHRRIRVVGAGILHVSGIKPQAVKIVTNIVMMMNVLDRSVQRISPDSARHPVHPVPGPRRATPALGPVVNPLQKSRQVAFDFNAAGTEKIAKPKFGIPQYSK